LARHLWRAVRKGFHALGLAQTFVLLALFYFLLFGPFALIARLSGRDFLGLRRAEGASFWRKRPPEQPTLERARRQS